MANEELEPTSGEQPTIYTLYMPGGGMNGIIPLTVLARLEELTGKSPAELFQVMEGSSVGAYLIAGINVRDPENPDQFKYTMKDGIELFVKTTPEIFKPIPGRMAKMAHDQLTEGFMEWRDEWVGEKSFDIENETLSSFFNSVASGIKWALTAMPHYSMKFAKHIGLDWEPENYMFDENNL